MDGPGQASVERTQPRYFDRELSWLEFNARVLAEAMDPSLPLLERLKFLGIVSSNCDEFFMVRVASLEDEASESVVRARAFEICDRQAGYLTGTVIPELEAAGIRRLSRPSLDAEQLAFVERFFDREVFPVLTPVAISGRKPAPSFVQLSVYLVASLVDSRDGGSSRHAAVEIPRNFPRVIFLPAQGSHPYVLLEDVVSMFAARLFEGFEIADRGWMRLTRGAELTLDEEKDEDFAKVMTEALRQRMREEIVRLEVSGSAALVAVLRESLGVATEQVYGGAVILDLQSFAQSLAQVPIDSLKRKPWTPRPIPEVEDAEDLWELLRENDVLVHHPYDSFAPVVRFVRDAAEDAKVLAIKQTLYRTGGSDNAIVTALEKAAESGKRVTVLVELKARFDEAENIQWARRLEVAGASVLYGVAGLKTHAKLCLVVRRETEGIRRYVHLSTGNYNEKTARLYSDLGLFTSDESICQDASTFFNMITGYSRPSGFSQLVVAPFELRRRVKQLIAREAMRSSPENPGLIVAKMNSLVDTEIIDALYAASQVGVRVRLNVRGVCCLVPGVPGMSETIEVTSIVDMFLEHSRILYFRNGGDEEVYLTSGDWMPRNLDRRIELMFPVNDPRIRRRLSDLLDLYFKDNLKSHRLRPDGSYERPKAAGEEPFRVQEHLCKEALGREDAWRREVPKELRPQRPRES